MLTIYNCIVNDHDFRLVFLAGVICAISALTAVSLLQHIREATGRVKWAWVAIAAAAGGFGIWATHFIAMLAFAPDVGHAYDLPLTLISLLLATLATGAGIAIATSRDTSDHHLVGGAVIGGGIAAMHFVGMAAYEVEGRLLWDQRFVALSLVAGTVFGALAIRIVLGRLLAPGERRSKKRVIAGALALTLAICGLHFVGMAAVTIVPDATIVIPSSSIPAVWLAGAVAVAAFTILMLSTLALWLDIRDLRRDREEEGRMRDLANAAVEGLVVCDGDAIVTANGSFLALTGRCLDDIAGTRLNVLIPGLALLASGETAEAAVRHAGGHLTPVEILARHVDYGGAAHTVYAIRDLSERKKAEAEIRHLALHDPLTGLPNRRAFTDKLAAEIAAHNPAADSKIALLCLDLDRFKEVNDLFGHAAGDALLQRVATCVTAILDSRHMLARLGGDEFAIVAPGLAGKDSAAALAETVLAAFRDANINACAEGLMATSIGVALYPGDAIDADTLVSHADTALYRAKVEGRNTWRFYDSSMGHEVRQRRVMEHELRHAAARNQFHLVYQPQKRLDTGETLGFEALLRWTHPVQGDIAPSIFVPLAEENGSIVQIGEWVLEQACAEAAQWDNHLIVAVNVSGVQLHSPDFAGLVHTILLRTGLSPQRLEIEITETALVRDMNRALTALRQIKALGVRVAMDDFGTGYSSLSNLRAFPFDKIKIDGSFIRSVDRNEQAATIVKAVLGIGRGLGLPVLAEGVETIQELNFLAGELCQIGQGYYLGKPASIDSFSEDESREPAAVA